MAVPIHTVDGCEILHQLKTVVDYPIIYRVSTSFNHPFGARFRKHCEFLTQLARCSHDAPQISFLLQHFDGAARVPRGSRSALAMQGSQVRSRPIWSWLKELRHFFGEGWLVVEVYLLLWKMMEWVKVSWDDDIPFPIWWESHNPFHGSSHHQAFIGDFNDFMRFLCWNCMGFFVDVSNWSKAEGETERITDTKY